MIYCTKFSYEPQIKTLDEFPDYTEGKMFEEALVAFIHAEPHDESEAKGVETKLVKNLKWAAKKNGTKNVVLHSFAHLAETKATPEFTKDLFDKAETPFGYFLDIDVQAPGVSQARIFKSF